LKVAAGLFECITFCDHNLLICFPFGLDGFDLVGWLRTLVLALAFLRFVLGLVLLVLELIFALLELFFALLL
jgi:hypothetical protein